MSLSSTNQSSSHGGSTSTSSQQHLDQQQVQSNQKLSIFARLIPEDLIAQKQEYKEGIRQEKCIFKLNKHEIQIIQPDEKRILEEIDAFQKRERIQHSPPKFYIGQQKEEINQRSISPIGQQQNANYVNKTVRNEGNAVAQEDLDLNQRRNNFQEITPEKDRNKHIKPFQSPISKISYFENSNNDSRPNTFTFDQIFDESVNDEEFFNRRDLTYDTQQLSMKEENQILSQKNHMIKEQVRIITADLIHHQEQLSKLQKENSMYLSDIRDLKRIIVDQDNQLMAYKKKISDQTSKIDGMKKNFGILDNFDKSMVIDSKNKSFNKILSNIYSSKKSFHEIETQDQETQTDFISNNLERDVSNNLKKSLQDERISQQNKNIQNYYQNQQEQNFCKNCKQNLDVNQTDSNINNQMNYKSFNALQDIASSDFENYPFLFNEDDKNDIITPNRFLQNLDDILLNLDSKRSTYFSPRNLSLANLALIENEGYKQKLLIKDQEIEKLQFKLKEINSSLQQKDSQFKFKDQERLVHLKQIEKLITLFEKKLIGCDQIIADIVEYYENELLEFKKIIQFGFQAYTNEIKELQKDIHVINQEKQKWGQVFAKKTEEIYKQMSSKIQQKNEKIKQYEEVLQKFGQIGSYK